MAYCGPRGIPLLAFLGWDELSQQAALEWQAHEASRCQECGTHREDWAGEEDPQHWHTEVCPGCARKQRARDQLGDDDQVRGSGLVAADGSMRTCDRCMTQIQLRVGAGA